MYFINRIPVLGVAPAGAMDFAISVPNKKTKQKSVSSYAASVFSESTIGIVSNIVTTGSRGRRVFKSVVLFLCIVGFLYQSVTYLLYVFEYPTVIGLDIQRPEEFILPAYTFCSNNGMKRSVFCSLHPDRCYEASEEFCSKWKSYCGKNKTLIPKKEYYEVEDTMSFEDILKYGDHLEDLIVRNKSIISGDIKGPYIRTKDETDGAMICYNLHSVAESSETPNYSTKHPYPFFRFPVDKLTLYVEEYEMLIPGNSAGIFFSVHSPYQTVNPFKKGLFMMPGRNYIIYVRMEEEVLLQEPFKPTCMNYIEIWEANNRTGPRIQEMCLYKCFFEASMNCHNCCIADIIYPNKEKMCKMEEALKNGKCSNEDYDEFYKCADNCKTDCRITKYYSEVFERFEVDHKETDEPEESRRYITVEIYLEESEIVTMKHSPKYMSVEVFSAIGGFIGVWLGISLMDVIDVFASAFSVCRYTIRKNQKQ